MMNDDQSVVVSFEEVLLINERGPILQKLRFSTICNDIELQGVIGKTEREMSDYLIGLLKEYLWADAVILVLQALGRGSIKWCRAEEKYPSGHLKGKVRRILILMDEDPRFFWSILSRAIASQ